MLASQRRDGATSRRMALGASSTLAEIEAELKAAASYRESDDLGLAQRYLTAIGLLIVLRPSEARNGNQQFAFATGTLRELQRDALKFVGSKNSGATKPRYASVRRFRT